MGKADWEVSAGTRATLLAATGELIDEKDMSSISVADIVRRADVTRPTFYKAFGSLPQAFAGAALLRLAPMFSTLDLSDASTEELNTPASIRETARALEEVLSALLPQAAFARKCLEGPAARAVIAGITDFVAGRLLTTSPFARVFTASSLPDTALAGFFAAGVVKLVAQWLSEEPGQASAQALAQTVSTLLHSSAVGGIAAT